jgi:hypothetical protein
VNTRTQFRPRVEELEARHAPATLSSSTNWSGYAVNTTAGGVSRVAANWVVPAVSSTVSGYSSAWVGIDGWSSSTVEQIGTDSDYLNGHAQYYGWYEMYPAAPVNLSLAIRPGDTISASVSYSGPNQFVLSITDVTTGGSFSTTQTLAQAQRSSAEWVQEAPSSVSGVLPLANFGTISFSGATATVGGATGPVDASWPGSTLYQINMVTRTGAAKATTSALSDSGNPPTSNFSVTWVSSGSGGHGGGPHSTNVPPADAAPTAVLQSAAVGPIATSVPATPPAFVAIQSRPGAVAAAAGVVFPAVTAFPAAPAHLGPDGVDPGTPADDQADMPELPSRGGVTVPAAPAAATPTDGLPAPQTGLAPANQTGASAEAGGVSEATADGFWLPVDSGEAAADGSPERRGTAIAGLVLSLTVAPAWANATQGQTGIRDGVPAHFGHRGGRRFHPRRRKWLLALLGGDA